MYSLNLLGKIKNIDFLNLNQNKILIFLCCLIVPLLVTGPFLPDLLLSSLSLWFLFYVFKNKKYYVFKNNFFYLFLAFCVFCIFSSIMSDEILLSFESSLFYFRIGIFCILIAYLIDQDKDVLKYFFYTLIITFSILIFYALIQYSFELNNHPTRISSFFGDELILGSYLSRLLPLIIGLFFIKVNKTNKEKYFFLIFICFTYFTVFLSGERAAFFYINLSFLFMFLFIRIKLKWIFLFSIINVTIFYAFIINTDIITGDRLVNRYTKNVVKDMYLKEVFEKNNNQTSKVQQQNLKKPKTEPENQSTSLETKSEVVEKRSEKNVIKNEKKKKFVIFTEGHQSLYQTALNMFQDRPIIGHGPKLFRVKCSDPNYAEGVASCMTHPHNFYIQLLAETGVIGFSFLFFLLIYLIFLSIKYFYYAYFKKKKIYSNQHICFLACLLITIWPFIPNGNFFNNYLMMLYCLPLGFIKKNQSLKY